MSAFAIRSTLWQPPVDVLVGSDHAWIRLAAPGASADDLRVSLRGRILLVAGRSARLQAPEGVHFVRAEITVGAFRRRIELPWEPEAQRIDVRAIDGIVEIAVWRAEEPKR